VIWPRLHYEEFDEVRFEQKYRHRPFGKSCRYFTVLG